MRLEGLLFQGPYDMADALTAAKVCLVLWLVALASVGCFIFIQRATFQPQSYFTDNLLAALGNLILFSLLVFVLIGVESIFLWGDKPVYTMQDMTQANLWPWIIGHLLAGIVLQMLVVDKWGYGQMNTLIFYSAVPVAVPLVGLIYLSMLWWPGLFTFPVLTATVMVSQTAVVGILAVPLGLMAVWFVILGPLKWSLS